MFDLLLDKETKINNITAVEVESKYNKHGNIININKNTNYNNNTIQLSKATISNYLFNVYNFFLNDIITVI